MNTIYIFGHKKPDTDSICASISLAYLKNKLGIKAKAMTLGNINNETRYALEKFSLEAPKYLNDVKLQIKDIDYVKDFFVYEKDSISSSYDYMRSKNLSGLPIVDENKKLIGLVTLKELAKELIQGDFTKIDTSYKNIIEVLKGQEILKFDEEIKGNVLNATFGLNTFKETVILSDTDILVVGDRQEIISYAINSKIKLIVIVGGNQLSEENYELAQKNRINIIRTRYDSYHTNKLINLSNYIGSVIFSPNPTRFDENDYYTTFEDVVSRLRHTNYPIIDKSGKCLGLFPVTLIKAKNPKKVILVDHNEKEQSVDGLEEAEIVEIVDHHKLGTLATTLPINFRNMAVGSTNTIIYSLYKENKVDIPSSIAGAMISGIISDTLLLKSPTTTKFDVEAVLELEKIAGIDYKKYGMELFKAGSSLSGKTKEEIIYEDFKKFNVDDINIGIGQVFTTDIDYIMNEKEEYIKILDNLSVNNGYNLLALFITDIINNGSYILYNTSSEELLKNSFDIENLTQGYYFKDIVSRKKQIIPVILDNLEKR